MDPAAPLADIEVPSAGDLIPVDRVAPAPEEVHPEENVPEPVPEDPVSFRADKDARIFAHEPMGLRDEMLRIPFDARFAYDEERNTLFLNFSEESVKSQATIDRYCDKIRSIVEPLGHKVYAVINYDGWEIDRSLEDAYLDVVKKISDQYYLGVTRFTTSAFMRAKLGDQLAARGVAPHIFESEAEAKDAVRETVSRTA